ncbi:MAG TPA: type II CAAX endopeptidase family protein [Actinomycetota bacterium]
MPGNDRRAEGERPTPAAGWEGSPARFIAGVFAVSAPLWLLGGRRLPVPGMRLPLSAVQLVAPLAVSCALAYREGGPRRVRRLLRRALDAKRIEKRIWYPVLVGLLPAVMLATYAFMRMSGIDLRGQAAPITAIPALLLIFLLTGAMEEIGWTGYATDPLQRRMGVLRAGLVLGVVWALWHLVPWIQGGNPPAWVVAQSFRSLALRVLIVCLYNATGKSVFAATLLHAFDNVGVALFPGYDSPQAPAISGVLLGAAAGLAMLLRPGRPGVSARR